MSGTEPPMTLLISTHIEASFRPRIAEYAGERLAVRASSLDAPLAFDVIDDITAAYLSLDVLRSARNPQTSHAFAHFSELLRAAPQLKWVHTAIAGADHPLYRDLIARGVSVTTSSGANAHAVAHSAVAGMMALARGVPQWLATQRRKAWEPLDGPKTPRDLPGQHVTVVGLGPIGIEIGRIAQALGMHVSGVSRSAKSVPGFDRVVTFDQLPAVLSGSDWLILACPLTDLTRNLVDRFAFDRLPDGARMVNVSRGGVVDEDALLGALRTGRLAGAYSDVFAIEPLPVESPLWEAPNLIISSHTAGRTDGAESRATQIFLDNLRRWLVNEPLVNLVGRSTS